MAYSFKKLSFELIQWVYPPLCLHCQTPLHDLKPLFCPSCLHLLTLATFNGRCHTCFKELGKSGCDVCKKRRKIIHLQIAAAEGYGPAKTLLNSLQKADRKSLNAAASLMAYQWLKQEKNLPDFLIPLPLPRIKKLFSENDPTALLTKALSKILGVPVLSDALRARYDHAAFIRGEEMRYAFDVNPKRASQLTYQHILLISPLLEDETLRRAGSALQMAYPAKMDGLSFAVVD